MGGFDYDFFTIGAGSGGVRASRVAGGLGAKVGIAEERYLGGTCVNVGCVPKKLFTYAARYGSELADAAAYGWAVGERRFDWPALIANKNREIDRLNGVYRRLLENTGCRIFSGRARLLDAHTVEVAGERVTAAHILIATGGWPIVPDFEGRELAVTSNEAFHFETLPERVVVGGGGYIAVEFAGILAGMGAEVTLVHRRDKVLRGFDEDIRTLLTAEIPKHGVRLAMQTSVERVSRQGDGLAVRLKNGETLLADQVLCCYGRSPLTQDLGLEVAGVKTDANGAVVVDEAYQTSVPHIFAVGDVIARKLLTPVALAEGMLVAQRLFGDRKRPVMSYENIATAVFSHPHVGTVGLTEAEARERFSNIDIYHSQFRPMRHTMTGRDHQMMMKLVVDRDTDRVLGVHMVGDEAGEIIQGFAVALNCGAKKAQLDQTIGIHPTAAEELVTLREKRA